MSKAELQVFKNRIDSLSIDEQVDMFEYLFNKIKHIATNQEKTEKGVDVIFSLMDANPLSLQNKCWTREELYER